MCRCLLASRSRVHVCTLIRYPVFDIISMMRLSALAAFFIQYHGFLLQIWWKGHRLESLPPLPLPWRIKRRQIRRTIIIESILISVSFFLYYGFNTLLPPSPVSSGLKKSILESFSTLFNVASSKSFIYHHMRSQNDCQCIPLVE